MPGNASAACFPRRAAFIAAAIFAVSPIQSEAVDYVWARSILLATILALAAFRASGSRRPWIAVLWFALALLAKEECAAFPLVLAWLGWRRILPTPPVRRPLRRHARARRRRRSAVIWASASRPGRQAGQRGNFPLHYFLAQGVVIWRYLQLTILPCGFTVDPDIHVTLWIGIVAWALLLSPWPS